MRHDSTTRRWTLHIIISLFLVLISQPYATVDAAAVGKCAENEYENSQGDCCDKCHPGYRLKKECPAQGKRSVCEKCKSGTYLNTSNYNPTCWTCKKCDSRDKIMFTVSNCTITKNSECKCKEGYYMKMLDEWTPQCRKCKTCGDGQLTVGNCTGDNYDHCICKDKHYKVKNNLCKPCDECIGCEDLCEPRFTTEPTLQKTISNNVSDKVSQIVFPICACIIAVMVGVFLLYEAVRIWRKRKRASSNHSSSRDDKAKSEDEPMMEEASSVTEIKDVSISNQLYETELRIELPDCVPREIKIAEFFYFVLDEIPVGRFKELVRRLGVSEPDIERAENDHRACKDAQYQMLKVWSDRCGGGGNNILSCHLIQMFIDTLRDMYLSSCADSVETKFLSQDRPISQ
ncbi:tumor necrosis factor receptor superfamily member 1A isoform X1 [Misgurnus anguillicaudatus]|uniref:tumor necrosis factor receptor superfamily member 1A isoform X1 n=1 Tax=Misgurnus anguillicaudatus TaxID=75329 RepID=UPI003CCF446A